MKTIRVLGCASGPRPTTPSPSAENPQLSQSCSEAFPFACRDTTDPAELEADMALLERAHAERRFLVHLNPPDDSGLLRLKLFQPDTPVTLSDRLPLIENMGLRVEYMGWPHEILCKDCGRAVYLYDFACRLPPGVVADVNRVKPLFEEAFTKAWLGEAEHDALSAATLQAGLPWRAITILRAFVRYLHQLRVPYTVPMMMQALVDHPDLSRLLVNLFEARHDPDLGESEREARCANLTTQFLAGLGGIQVLEDDHILRRCLNLVQASLRTNYFQQTPDGHPKAWLAIKFDSRAVDYMPLPKPLVEVFVASPRVEALHLRGGKVARGGIRWSDRRDDFRSEILGLMKAQMVKNSVIVPVGSKGGFIVKHPPTTPEELQAEGRACYTILMQGLLDITDNIVGGKLIPPPRVVRHDGDDPYLVVAADKGTATFSDLANSIARTYGFWLDDAFASGGSAGYDHKQMGITARGAWESVRRHFREKGLDSQTQPFTCVGVGDMSGDVFGNGMLLSKTLRLIAAFDHRHIFLDPSPDAATSWTERKRLFDLPHSSWDDYDRSLLSPGGGVFPRTAKVIPLSPDVQKALGVTADRLTPVDLIKAILRAPVDLVYFGGIGTYVKAPQETHKDVADRANDSLRIDGTEIRARVVVEGANLGVTQLGRIAYAQHGGQINTDAIDNSAGVDTSDHEVNIKIFLHQLEAEGSLTRAERDTLLQSMTDDVARLVLRDNYRQTQALSLAEARAVTRLPAHARSLRALEKDGLLNRAVEFLPDDTAISERHRLGQGLTRPELAVLLAYAKLWLYDAILTSDLPEDPFLQNDLITYFPVLLREKYAHDLLRHSMRREIIATRLTNSFINRVGSPFVFAIAERTGRSAPDVTRAYLLARGAFSLHDLWGKIESLDAHVSAETQTMMLLTISRTLSSTVSWLLTQEPLPSALTPGIERHQRGIERLAAWLESTPTPRVARRLEVAADLEQRGVPAPLAKRVALMPLLTFAPEITLLAETYASGRYERAARVFLDIEARFAIVDLRERAERLRSAGSDSVWQREAGAELYEDILNDHRDLTANVLTHANPNDPDEVLVERWAPPRSEAIARYDARLTEARAAGSTAPDLAVLLTFHRALTNFTRL